MSDSKSFIFLFFNGIILTVWLLMRMHFKINIQFLHVNINLLYLLISATYLIVENGWELVDLLMVWGNYDRLFT